MKWRRIPGIKKLLLGRPSPASLCERARGRHAGLSGRPAAASGHSRLLDRVHVGANVGYHFGKDNISATADPIGWGTLGAGAINSLTETSLAPAGSVVGAQIGFNWQVGHVVFGWEGDGEWLGGSSTGNTPWFPRSSPPATSCKTPPPSERWRQSVRGSAGRSATSWPTARPGAPWAGSRTSIPSARLGGTTSRNAAEHDVRPGWTGGGGIEWKFLPAWSVKAEYLYFHMQNYNTASRPARASRTATSSSTTTPPTISSASASTGTWPRGEPVRREIGKRGLARRPVP